ncbi:hypothetical protein Hdeb2414_s0006g00219731 [Helianthus debilis subsp. tardiflorus]
MLFQTTIPRAESKGESEDELNAKGSVHRSQDSFPEELVTGKPGVDPKARKLDERGSLKSLQKEGAGAEDRSTGILFELKREKEKKLRV